MTYPGRRSGQPSSREALIRAAEKLFGEQGIGSVSLRHVAAAAGQRNNSAVRYQFGSREGLIDAIFAYRMGRIDERRRAMLAGAGARPGLRRLLEAFVYPLAESVGHDEGTSWYVRFLRQVVFDPEFDVFAPERAEYCRGLRSVVDGITQELSGIPDPLRSRRLLQVSQMVVHSLADHEAQLAHGRPALPTPVLVADLVDCAEAVLNARVSPDTERELAVYRKKEA